MESIERNMLDMLVHAEKPLTIDELFLALGVPKKKILEVLLRLMNGLTIVQDNFTFLLEVKKSEKKTISQEQTQKELF